jgi:cell division protein FtsI/penicillin-binding protein 2
MKKLSNWRINIVLFFIIIFGAAIISRLFFLQISERKLFQAQALGQQVGFSNITGTRGQIFCVSSQKEKGSRGTGEVKSLSINTDSWTISANPNQILDSSVFTEILGNEIEIDKEDLILKLENQDSNNIIIKRKLSAEDLDKIKKLNLRGLFWQNEPERFYPQAELLSQTVGFLGGEGKGQYGLEGFYENILQGKFGVRKEGRGLGSIFFESEQVPLNGSDLYLTIDYNIQFQAESLLKQAKKRFDIDEGQIIVMKPDSGRILALADFPFFDLNNYSKERSLEIFQNGAIQKLFEPGSIFKPFTMAYALNEGKITPDTTYVDTGSLKFGIYTIKNFNNKIYDKQTMTQVLESSVNTGAVFAQRTIENKKFFEYFEKFGFTEKTGIDLQGEVSSKNDNLRGGPDVSFATASFGQGIETTPIQIMRGFAVFANGGKLVKPYIVEKIVSGKDEISIKPEISSAIISSKTASDVTSMLISTVENGFNQVSKIPGYYIAGKTGTAQVPLKNKRGYETDKTIQSFIGYGPALNPQFLILVKLDSPKVPQSSLSAVPLFNELAQYIINYWQIPPDYEISSE